MTTPPMATPPMATPRYHRRQDAAYALACLLVLVAIVAAPIDTGATITALLLCLAALAAAY